MSGPLVAEYEGPAGRILVSDSLTYCDERVRTTDVIVGGSFVGTYPTALALSRGTRAIIGNAAGVGKDEAGIAGLALADRWSVPCAALSAESARLADGPDGFQNGVVSHANQAAEALGVRRGAACAEAARLMLAAAPGQVGRAAELVDLERAVVWKGPEGRVSAMASVGLATADNRGDVICAGSHTGLVTWRYVSSFTFPVAGVICNDAAVGKDESGVAGLQPLTESGVAAAAVSHHSARIGEGTSTYHDGVISHANELAIRAGVEVGMSAREAALLMLRAAAIGRVAQS